jgi:hypothetical protein
MKYWWKIINILPPAYNVAHLRGLMSVWDTLSPVTATRLLGSVPLGPWLIDSLLQCQINFFLVYEVFVARLNLVHQNTRFKYVGRFGRFTMWSLHRNCCISSSAKYCPTHFFTFHILNIIFNSYVRGGR